MLKGTFNEQLIALYPQLMKHYVARFGDRAEDALHDAILTMYDNRAYKRVAAKGNKLKPFLKRVIMYGLGHQGRSYARNEGRTVPLADEQEQEILEKTELQTDVRVAVGKLSLEQQLIIKAIFWDGDTLREVAARTGQTVYRVFTEFEIAKACLRESLKDYAPRVYRVK